MTNTKNLGALAAAGLLLVSAIAARAAGAYTLTCDAARSGNITIQLTGFNVAVTGSGSASPDGAVSGLGAGRRESTKFALTVQTDSGKDYETLLSMLEDDEVLRSCKLVDGEVSGGGMTAKDNWTQEAVTKGKNKSKTNAAPAAGGGGLEWILTNATVTSVTVNAGPNATGVPTTTIQATIDAQKFSFTT